LAQLPTTPHIHITQVDTTRFPEITISLSGANLPATLAEVPIRLLEDGEPVIAERDIMASVGVQVALILDASSGVTNAGATGEAQYLEVGRAARQFVRLGLLTAQQDWLTTVSFNADKQIIPLTKWTHDHQAAVDSLYIYQPVPEIGFTPLYDLLDYGIDLFEDASLPNGQEQVIVLFSDGVDITSSTALADAVSQAAQQHIRIYTVQIGPEIEANRETLTNIAELTGGTYYHLSAIEALDHLWREIAALQEQRQLTYRTGQSHPGTVTTIATLPNGQTVEHTSRVPPISLQPATLTVDMSENGTLIRKFADAYDTPIERVPPFEQEIKLHFSWPDGYPRGLRRVEYELGGITTIRTENFEEPLAFPIQTLGSGAYSLRVRAIDELGMQAESQPITLLIEENRPPAPLPTADPMMIARATEAEAVATISGAEALIIATRTAIINTRLIAAEEQVSAKESKVRALQWTTLGAILFGILALTYALYILSNRDRRRQATQAISGTVAAMTEPFRPRRGRQRQEPQAQLTLIDDGGTPNLPKTITLSRVGVRLGRDPSLVDIPLSDRRISKLHCRVNEDIAAGSYRLIDEGSTSGTYLNDHEVDIHGVPLKPGDIIGIGPVQYRYVIVGNVNGARNESANGVHGEGKAKLHNKAAQPHRG